MPVIPSGYCEVTWHTAVSSGYRPQSTAMGFSIAGFNTSTGPNALNNAWDTFLQAISYAGGSPSGPVIVRVGTADPSAPLVYESGVQVVSGTQTTTAPPNIAMLLEKRTLLGGRKGRGRCFLPGPPEGSMDRAGVLDSTFAVNAQAAVDAWISASETVLGGVAYLLHSDATPPTVINELVLQNIVATQRRRLTR